MNNSQIEIYQLKDEILKLKKTTVQLEKRYWTNENNDQNIIIYQNAGGRNVE